MKKEPESKVTSVTHPRTRNMMDVAVAHARAAFQTSCAPKAPKACQAYEGSAWNGGRHVTVIVDRCDCEEHDNGKPSFARVEAWLYDISGESIVYLGKEADPRNAQIPMEPGDVPVPMEERKSFLRH